MNMDPLAEKFMGVSPYNYAMNNPVYFIDPDGRTAEGNSGSESSDDGNEKNAMVEIFSGIKVNAATHPGNIGLSGEYERSNNGDPKKGDPKKKNKVKDTNDKVGAVGGAYNQAHDHDTYTTTGKEKKSFFNDKGKLRSRRATKMYNFSKFVKGVPIVTFGITLGFDVIGTYNYYEGDEDSFQVHPAKATTNTGMGLLGFTGFGTPASRTYFLIDAFHQEGIEGAIIDNVESQQIYRSQHEGRMMKPQL